MTNVDYIIETKWLNSLRFNPAVNHHHDDKITSHFRPLGFLRLHCCVRNWIMPSVALTGASYRNQIHIIKWRILIRLKERRWHLNNKFNFNFDPSAYFYVTIILFLSSSFFLSFFVIIIYYSLFSSCSLSDTQHAHCCGCARLTRLCDFEQ
jgi:hypothetical protein